MPKLSDTVERKFEEVIPTTEWEVWSDTGWVDVSSSNLTVEYTVWKFTTKRGLSMSCADTHIIFDSNLNERFVKDLCPGDLISTEYGIDEIATIECLGYDENMYDLSVASLDQRYYTDGVLSHNSQTTASYLLWHILFHPVKSWAVLANKDATAKEILNQKLQVSYELLPFWLQQGVVSWNKGSIELENKSRVLTAATSSGGIRGCVPTESKITVRDKNTGVVSTIDIGELAFSLNNNTKICENGLIYVEDVIRE